MNAEKAYNNIHLEQIPSGKHSNGPFNLARVNSYHSRLADLNVHHKVCASKYCNIYLAMFQWIDRHRAESTEVQKNQIFNFACGKVKLFQRKHYGKKFLPFDTKGIINVAV